MYHLATALIAGIIATVLVSGIARVGRSNRGNGDVTRCVERARRWSRPLPLGLLAPRMDLMPCRSARSALPHGAIRVPWGHSLAALAAPLCSL
jgi:hypothetical protein